MLAKVNSSNVEAVGYTNNNLLVKFKNGTMYQYSNVPQDLYESLLKAPSVGSFMNEKIKGWFDYVKVNPEDVEKAE